MMTALSCVAIGLAFVLAVALLVLAGIVIGLLPAWWRTIQEARARARDD